jgi:hypothetical protein
MPSQANGSRTAVARSGRDGRLLWTADLGLRRGWFERDRAENYFLSSASMPAGDLDGDGTPDVIVQENNREPPARVLRNPATLPLLVLSGRTGRPAWVAGPLPLDFEAHGYSAVDWAGPRIIEPGTAPDLLVQHSSPFSKASPTPPPANAPTQDRLARLSGRTGRILWDIPLGEQPKPSGFFGPNIPHPIFEDLDGDGGLDAVLVTRGKFDQSNPGVDLQGVSLRDGRMLWSQHIDASFNSLPYLRIFDGDDGRRPAIAAMWEFFEDNRTVLRIRAFDGRDGTTRWSWNSGALFYDGRPEHPGMVSARLEKGKPRRICATFRESGGKTRIVVLDDRGKEQFRRDLAPEYDITLRTGDLDGDGRDELVFWHGGRLHAWGGDMAELWSSPDRSEWIESILPASAGDPALVMLRSGVTVDGKTGLPRWSSQTRLEWPPSPGTLLDPGSPSRRPLLVYNPASAMSIVRSAMATTPAGVPASPVGDPVPPGRADGDPRWTRPLPWTGLILYTIGPRGVLAFIGLAIINVAVPLALVALAARRRPWTLRLLMALPIAAAVPLTVFQTIEPLIPVQIGPWPASSKVVFAASTMAGVPVVAAAALVIASLVRLRWKPPALFAGSSLVASAIVAAAWLWSDRRTMPAVERYDRSEWYLAVLLGSYAVGVLIAVGWVLRAIYRAIRRRGTHPARPVDGAGSRPTMESSRV